MLFTAPAPPNCLEQTPRLIDFLFVRESFVRSDPATPFYSFRPLAHKLPPPFNARNPLQSPPPPQTSIPPTHKKGIVSPATHGLGSRHDEKRYLGGVGRQTFARAPLPPRTGIPREKKVRRRAENKRRCCAWRRWISFDSRIRSILKTSERVARGSPKTLHSAPLHLCCHRRLPSVFPHLLASHRLFSSPRLPSLPPSFLNGIGSASR